ncbi:MAG: protein kinase [Myxococcales bacterium]|nr:protein kinase [Myxococcales bacterium]
MARCSTCHRRLASGRPCPEHGGTPAPAEAAEPGAPFVWDAPLGALLGSGGFASVWEVPSGVLKVAHADHELARARMAREAEALAAIGAPAVPRFDGTGVLAGGRAWIAMEKVSGQGLTSLTFGGALGAERAVSIVLATLEALRHVHAAGFIHRDLKPDNLVRRADGSVVILDLGLARKLPTDPDDPTRANVAVGSLEYMPPEQLVDAASVGVASDLYAIGCILFELCAGRPPFVGDAAALERAHAALRPARLGAMAAVPAALEGICADCLAKDPARRPQDVAALIAALRATRDTPTQMRTSPAVSQISESRQPVVLLWIELAKVDRAVLSTLTARHVLVISQRGRKVLAALLGSAHADPATTALALAKDLAAGGARVALHLDALQIDSTGAAPILQGEAVANPETWLPAAAWTGVILTRAIAAVAQVPTRAADAAGPGFRFLGEDADLVELVGRDGLLTDLAADAAAAVHGIPPQDHRSGSGTWGPAGPALAVLIGDAGTGKTAFAAELARRIGEFGGRGVRVVSGAVPAPGSGKPPPLAALIGTPTGPAVRAIGDALRAAARSRPTVVILDDLHLAEHDFLDALEYATLGGEALPLWVLGIAGPRLDVRRPKFGANAERHRRFVLPVLDEDAAVQLTAKLLEPAEYPPLRALRQLVGLARGSPLHLTMLAREIHERGAIRKRPNGEAFLDTSALDELEPIALGPWLAARELAPLGPELAALARVAAVVGGEPTRDELAAVIDTVEQHGGATSTIDLDVGLRELRTAGLIVTTPRGMVFRQALVEEGIYATTDSAMRRAIHDAALAYALGLPGPTAGEPGERGEGARAKRVARHAEAVGAADHAAAAYTSLGERAEHEHRALDADHAWAGALRHVDVADARRARALLGQARARTHLQRLREAVAALDEAIAIARTLGDLDLEVEALLEQAIVLDFSEDWERSRAVAAEARARLSTGTPNEPGLVIDSDLAAVRALYREQRYAEAAPILREVFLRAKAARRTQSATIAALMLGCALSDLGELDEAERVFDEMIAGCVAHDDRFHLAAAYGNRAWLWSARGELDRTSADLRLATQLARETGMAHFERVSAHNLAEQLLWRGQLDEALPLARRGLALQSKTGEGSTGPDRMLLARILAARGDRAELALVLATFANEETSGDEGAVLGVLRIIAGDRAAPMWDIALAATDLVFVQLRLEVWQLAASHHALDEDRRTQARALAAADPVWRHRTFDP